MARSVRNRSASGSQRARISASVAPARDHLAHPARTDQLLEHRGEENVAQRLQVAVGIDHIPEGEPDLPRLVERHFAQIDTPAQAAFERRMLGPRRRAGA